MNDYSDDTTWKEVEEMERYTLSEWEEYSPEDVFKICQDLIEKSEQSGLQGCYLRFNSEYEPYETWLAFPTISVIGYRKLGTSEKEAIQEEYRIANLAKELDTTIPNARAVYQLRKEGKL